MAINAAIQNRMATAGLNHTMPAWTIVDNAKLLPPTPGSTALFGDPVGQALRKLMKSFYEFGRGHWTWTQNAGGAAANGGLVKSLISGVACGSFNHNFKWLAENALAITGITTGQETAQFLTMPESVGIDSKWVGNVRTATKIFTNLKCFKFSGHYWVMHGGVNYDVCYNNTFTTTSQIIWTKLRPAGQDVLKSGALQAHQVYKLEKPLPEGDHLVMVQQNGANGWPTWQIVPKAQLLKL
jgi:hypothetical protein